jgi:hypothetical protein
MKIFFAGFVLVIAFLMNPMNLLVQTTFSGGRGWIDN